MFKIENITKSNPSKFNYTFLNFFLIFTIAIIIVQLLKLLTVYFCAKFIGLFDVYLTPYYVIYSIDNFKNWSRFNVVILYGLPNLLMLFYAGMFWFLYRKTPTNLNVALKFLFYALMVNAFTFFISDILIAPFYHTGIKVVLQWFYFNENWIIPISIVSLMILPVVAILNTKQTLRFANSSKFVKNRNSKMSFILSHLLLSSLMAGLFFFLIFALGSKFNLDNIFFVQHVIIMCIVLLYFLLIAFFNYSSKFTGLSSNKDLQLFYPAILAAFIVLVLIVAIVLFFQTKF